MLPGSIHYIGEKKTETKAFANSSTKFLKTRITKYNLEKYGIGTKGPIL